MTIEQHFYGCNGFEWKTDSNLHDVIKWFENERYNGKPLKYELWFVPLPPDSSYKISQYAPQVEGAQYLGTFKTRKLIVN